MISIQIKEAQKVNGDLSAFISFPYDTELVGLMRNQSSRFWHAANKEWEVPANKLLQIINAVKDKEITITGDYKALAPKEVKIPKGFNFKTNPFEHQIEGFEFGLKHDRFLLGDEQGLGKTKQVIDIAVAKKLSKGYKHCLIICGVNGLKWNWKSEIDTHSNETAHILGTKINSKGKEVIGSSKDKLADLNKLPKDYFLITNVESLRDRDILKKVKELIQDGQIKMVAIDEIHKCKNPASQQGKAILQVNPETRIAMTGTPLMNTPLDLYIVLKWLGFEKHSFYQFKNHYCIMGGYGGYEVVGYRNLGELQSNLESLMLRRLKKDALDLPEKFHSIEYVEMSSKQAKVYKEVKQEIKEQIDKIKVSNNPLAQLIRLRQATGFTGILSSQTKESAKLDRLEEIVEELVESGEKAIIFSNWTGMTGPTMERLRRFNPAIITGETKDRKEQQERFMTDPRCKVIIGTTGAMGTGLTLTAASTVIFLDSPWNRANKEQAEDRAHRIGTTSNVNIITIVCKNTIDERIEELVNKKGVMADALVDGRVDLNNKSEVIDYLLG
jgi:SNF2 family DNA or RNA helicase